MATQSGGASFSGIAQISLTWVAPAAAAAAGYTPTTAVWVASAVASLAEGALLFFQGSKDLRRLLLRMRLLPFPVRLAFVIGLQLWFSYMWAAPSASLPSSSQSAGGPAVTPQGFVAHTETDASAPVFRTPASQATARDDSLSVVQMASIVQGNNLLQADEDEPFIVDADPASLVWTPKTLSVVLPCAEEREYAFKTVQAVWESTPRSVPLEIIVVDDGSEPPLSTTHLTPEVQKRYNLRVLRHDTTVGLIGAKKTGGDGATGDIIAFFDCHVAPQPGWHEAFFRMIGQNYRRLVVPQITALDVGTWKQIGSGGGLAKCYLTWDADFKWFDSDDMYVAVISGGLLGMSRRWWKLTGGYDVHMMGWGGENLDQSLRMWLCGGEIVSASDSFVAHMWRTSDDRTRARYKHVGDSHVNRARAVYAWYGEFAEKLKDYPSFVRPSYGDLPWYGNLSNMLQIKDNLKCRPFSWFLRRFKAIYEDAGLIPESVFMLREELSGKCLRFDGTAGTSGSGSGTATLSTCSPSTDARLFWHLGNKNKMSGRCCDGMRAWNTDQCLQEVAAGRFKTGVCDVSGRNGGQTWSFVTAAGELRQRESCVGSAGSRGELVRKPCISLRSSGSRWSKTNAEIPLETRLYTTARKDHPEVFESVEKQLRKVSSQSPSACDKHGGCFNLYRPGSKTDCLDENTRFAEDAPYRCWNFYYKDGALHSALALDECLDRWNDNSPETWGFAPCHGGENQRFTRNTVAATFCDEIGECLGYASVPS